VDDDTDPPPFPELKANDRAETDVVKQQKMRANDNVIKRFFIKSTSYTNVMY
jgi:hypothetical protein